MKNTFLLISLFAFGQSSCSEEKITKIDCAGGQVQYLITKKDGSTETYTYYERNGKKFYSCFHTSPSTELGQYQKAEPLFPFHEGYAERGFYGAQHRYKKQEEARAAADIENMKE